MAAGIVIIVAIPSTWFGLQWWVENIEMNPLYRPPRSLQNQIEYEYYGWKNETPGYSGAHLNRGTDPKLPWSIRQQLRMVWANLNWLTLKPEDEVFNEEMKIKDEQGVVLLESSLPWIRASEQNLLRALKACAALGIELQDPTVLEVAQRLADVNELYGGSMGLNEAQRLWIGYWQLSRPLMETEPYFHALAILAAQKAGELGLRIANQNGDDSEEKLKAESEAKIAVLWSVENALKALIPVHTEGTNSITLHPDSETLSSPWYSKIWPFFKRLDITSNSDIAPLRAFNFKSRRLSEFPFSHSAELIYILNELDRFGPFVNKSPPSQIRQLYRSISSLITVCNYEGRFGNCSRTV